MHVHTFQIIRKSVLMVEKKFMQIKQTHRILSEILIKTVAHMWHDSDPRDFVDCQNGKY